MAPRKKKSSSSANPFTDRVGKPRFGQYEKLLGRFYEVVFLLKTLGQVREGRTPYPTSPDTTKERLRRFLRGIAYLCDFQKGGDTCTGIALQETETEYIFWAASNKYRPDLADFIKHLLARLRDLRDAPEVEKKLLSRNFQAMCFEKSAKRIRTYETYLGIFINKVIVILSGRKANYDQKLSSWLSSLLKDDTEDLVELCNGIFAVSKQSRMLELLRLRGKLHNRLENGDGKRNDFDNVRHYIGRLAAHTRIHNQLCKDVEDHLIGEIIENPVVRQIDEMKCIPDPPCDTHTHLQGIVKRMISDETEREAITNKLIILNDRYPIYDQILFQFDKFAPTIHGEVQILEHFYLQKLKFANNDKYIACSKPSCECCYLYFKYHRARMVIPESSRKIYSNWSLPAVANPHKEDPEFIQQRNTLNKMIDHLREDAVQQILECRSTPNSHPDSLTELSITTCPWAMKPSDGSLGYRYSLDHEVTGWDFSDEETSKERETDRMMESDGEDSDTDNGGVLL